MTGEVRDHTVPVALAQQVAELVRRWRVPPGDLFSAVGLSEADLGDPLERLSLRTMCDLLHHARVLTGEPGLGYYLGLYKRASLYGYIGFAAQSAPSLREVLTLAMRYAPVFSTALSIDLSVDGDVASLWLKERADLAGVRDVVLISMTFGLQTIGASLTGMDARPPIELSIPQPHYYARFEHLAPDTRFGKPANRLLFDAAALDLPVRTADGMALQVARKLCERALDELGFDARLVEQVRRLLPGDGGGFRSLEQVAALVHLSPRTLKRRLAAQGISFTALVDRERRERADALLRSSRLTIQEVAEQLDYASASVFVRAFQRWTGTTPAAYRRERRRGVEGVRRT